MASPNFIFNRPKFPEKENIIIFAKTRLQKTTILSTLLLKQSKLASYNLFPYLEGQGGMKNVKCYSQDFFLSKKYELNFYVFSK